MKKIETLFLRDAKFRAVPVVNPGCEWVLAGEGWPTTKRDGTCCLVRDGKLYKRLEWQQGRGDPPKLWSHHTFDPTQRSGHGWLLVSDGPEDWMHRKAWAREIPGIVKDPFRDGTYELIGPCIGKNPEHCGPDEFILIPHGERRADFERTFEGIKTYLEQNEIEGVVWWRENGDMVKIKRRDFGLPWPVKR